MLETHLLDFYSKIKIKKMKEVNSGCCSFWIVVGHLLIKALYLVHSLVNIC